MSTSTNKVTSAVARFNDADVRLGDLIKRILAARNSAYECVKGMESLGTAQAGATMQEHRNAALHAGADIPKLQGEQRYWAKLHESLMGEVVEAKRQVVAAEKECVKAESDFWAAKWSEQCAAFYASNKRQLQELYATFTRVARGNWGMSEMIESIAEHAPSDGDYSEAIAI
ncbi:MAG: hypothetical protein WAT93_04230, partial [Pontixanthobacter sp.]